MPEYEDDVPAQQQPRGRRWGRLLVALVIGAVAIISYLMKTEINPVTGEKQRVAMNVDQERVLGLAAAPEMTKKMGGALDPANDASARLVAEVGARLVRLSNAARSPYADNFHFHLLSDPETINAFALPGGQVFITRGLFDRLANEAQVAAVLAHEIGHVIHRHSAEQMAKGQLGQTLTMAVGVASDDGRRGEMVEAAVNQMVQLKYGRGDESEADRYGLEAMAGAGYDPTAMLDVMRVLRGAAGNQRPPEFLSSHPLPETRLREIEEILRQTYPGGVPAALTKGRPLRNNKSGTSN